MLSSPTNQRAPAATARIYYRLPQDARGWISFNMAQRNEDIGLMLNGESGDGKW